MPAGGGAPKALKISGSTGKYKLINGTYQLCDRPHGNRPCWVASSLAKVYLFHTGKARWVISKALDDGTTCYAYVSDDTGNDNPSTCKGPWARCDETGWKKDGNITCVEVAASNDPFVKLRMSVEDEMRGVGITDEKSLTQLWRKIDKNGDNNADVGEVEDIADDMTRAGRWPKWMNCKEALNRAFDKTLEEDDLDDDQKVGKEEFGQLLLNMFWFCKLHEVFQSIQTKDDDVLDIDEFTSGMDKLGCHLTNDEVQREFRLMDRDRSGLVDFGEFCLYVRNRVCPEQTPVADTYEADARAVHEQIRDQAGSATSGVLVKKKTFKDFDDLEVKIKKLCAQPGNKGLQKLWKSLDFNGNNVVSLAEIDKWVVEQYPILNHKPALIRAMDATLSAASKKQDFVVKKDFKRLIVNLFYFNKLFWLFDNADQDNDRRMDLKEFTWCLAICGVKVSQHKAKSEFAKVDKNGGGIILFDEFCKYFTEKQCPQALSEFVTDDT